MRKDNSVPVPDPGPCCRQDRTNPQMGTNAEEVIKEYFIKIRSQPNGAISIRQIADIIQLARELALQEKATTITEAHVKSAIGLIEQNSGNSVPPERAAGAGREDRKDCPFRLIPNQGYCLKGDCLYDDDEIRDCPIYKRHIELVSVPPERAAGAVREDRKCTTCEGSGYIFVDESTKTCPQCMGDGKHRDEHLDVHGGVD